MEPSLGASNENTSEIEKFQKLGKSLGLQKKEISECTQIAVNTNGIEREAEQKCRACQGTIFLDFESDPKNARAKCGMVTDRAYVLDYTFFPWENYLNGDTTSASPRKPPPALAKLCETNEVKEVRISFGNFVKKDNKSVIEWLEKEQRRGMDDRLPHTSKDSRKDYSKGKGRGR